GIACLTSRDVSRFLNVAFKVYDLATIWPSTVEVINGNVVKVDEDGGETLTVPEMPGPSIVKESLWTDSDDKEKICFSSKMSEEGLVPDNVSESSSTRYETRISNRCACDTPGSILAGSSISRSKSECFI
ncbi:hypothetical protein OSTOST_16228, partial [Ostertagia ostertagi]